MVCPSVRGENPRALASGLAPVQADQPWNNYVMPPFPECETFHAKNAISGNGDMIKNCTWLG